MDLLLPLKAICQNAKKRNKKSNPNKYPTIKKSDGGSQAQPPLNHTLKAQSSEAATSYRVRDKHAFLGSELIGISL